LHTQPGLFSFTCHARGSVIYSLILEWKKIFFPVDVIAINLDLFHPLWKWFLLGVNPTNMVKLVQ